MLVSNACVYSLKFFNTLSIGITPALPLGVVGPLASYFHKQIISIFKGLFNDEINIKVR
jgi:hypothetical protein